MGFMISSDIYKYLKEDAALGALLKASEGNTKICPNLAKIITRPPFIVYRAAGFTKGEIIQEQKIIFTVLGETFEEVLNISERLRSLLDGKTGFESEYFDIYYSSLLNVADSVDDLGRHIRGITFNFKFRNKQENLCPQI
jgi:hypothetical protein